MRKTYRKPEILSEEGFESSALACGKTASPPPGSRHFGNAYDTFTGHLGTGFGGSSSVSGSAGVGFGPGGTSGSYGYSGLCGTWVTMTS